METTFGNYLNASGGQKMIGEHIEEAIRTGTEDFSDFTLDLYEILPLIQHCVNNAMEAEFENWKLSPNESDVGSGEPFTSQLVKKTIKNAIAAIGEHYAGDVFWNTFLRGGSVEDIANSDPQIIDEYRDRATALDLLRRHEDSIRDFSEVIKLNPTDPEMYFERGMQFRWLHNLNEAFADFGRAIDLDPTYGDDLARQAALGQMELDQAMKLGIDLEKPGTWNR